MKNLKTKLKILVTVLALFFGMQAIFALAWSSPVSTPPVCNSGNPGCDAPLNISSTLQKKKGTLWINTDGNTIGLIIQSGNVGIKTTNVSPGLSLDVEGRVGATEYCDENGANCVDGDSLQKRVSSSCGAGSSIRVINSDGTVTCETDDTGGGGGGGIDGSGSTNYVPKFTGATTLGNSQIYDTGSRVGIGKTNPSEKLHVQGNMRVEGNINTSAAGWIKAGSGSINNNLSVGRIESKAGWLGGYTYVDGNMTVGGTLRANNRICLGGVCESSWPSGGGAPSLTRRSASISGTGDRSATVSCPSGYTLLSGGVNASGGHTIYRSRPNSNGSRWECLVRKTTNSTDYCYALCGRF